VCGRIVPRIDDNRAPIGAEKAPFWVAWDEAVVALDIWDDMDDAFLLRDLVTRLAGRDPVPFRSSPAPGFLSPGGAVSVSRQWCTDQGHELNLRVMQEDLPVAEATIVPGGGMHERTLARDGFNSLSPFAWGIRLLPWPGTWDSTCFHL
jgi:hypothetical protein